MLERVRQPVILVRPVVCVRLGGDHDVERAERFIGHHEQATDAGDGTGVHADLSTRDSIFWAADPVVAHALRHGLLGSLASRHENILLRPATRDIVRGGIQGWTGVLGRTGVNKFPSSLSRG